MIENMAKTIDLVSPAELIPHPKNMHEHSAEQIGRLCKLIEYQGFRNPLVIQKGTGLVVAGHGRLEAAKQLNIEKVPVTYQEFESEEQLYAYMVSDNAIGKDTWATLDLGKINQDFLDLGPDLDIEMLGLKDFEIEPLDKLEPQTDEDAVPEIKGEPVTKKGDIWLLGNHRVMCGDSTMIDDVDKLMKGERADMVFTDPPYGMFLDTDYTSLDGLSPKGESFLGTSGGKKHKKVKGDNEDFNEDFINNIFGVFGYCKEIFLFGADYYSDLLINKNDGAWVVWDKRTNHDNDIEKALSADRLIGSSFELCWSKAKHKREIARVRNGIFGVKNESGNSKTIHPTQKPIQLAEWFFEKWGESKNTIVDVFLGSGSTLIACEKTNRKCYGMELDEHYCDVIVKRWEEYTGKKATLESNGEEFKEVSNA